MLPVTLSVKAPVPAIAEFGLVCAITGTGLLIVKVSGLEVPPPGPGLKTVMLATPARAISAVVMAAVNCPPPPKVVVRSLPFQRTTELLTKFAPVRLSVKAAAPAMVEPGLIWKSAGVGLLIVNVNGVAAPPPGAGLKTVTLAVPAVAMSAAVIVAVTCVELMKVVVRSAPFQRTTELLTKLVPVTRSPKAEPPTSVAFGFNALVVGTGLLMVNVNDLVVPPPGVGLKTVMLAAPAVAMSAAVIVAVNCVGLTKVVTRSPPFQRDRKSVG